MRLVAEHGGAFSAQLGPAVTLLVVGSDGWPLSPDGRVSKKLRLARRLLGEGRPLSIVSEQQFLELLLGQRPAAALFARPVGRNTGRGARALARLGAGRPGATGRVESTISYFDYGQVARAKSLADLVQAGIRPAACRQSLARLAGGRRRGRKFVAVGHPGTLWPAWW